ncbi:MAG TPA: VOC family protein [Chloroflexota bacterium]|nr:VOC family protein [Chloroflexota bacterium]
MRPHISYIAFLTDQPEREANFYSTYFGLKEIGRSAAGDVSMTDGFYNLTFLKRRSELGEQNDEIGIHHFGLAIDDIREFEGKLEEFVPSADIKAEPGDVHHGEYRFVDPNGLTVSLSTKHFNTAGQPYGKPAVHHLGMKVADGQGLLELYGNLIGLKETPSSVKARERGSTARFAGDGTTAWAIFKLGNSEQNEGAVNRDGLNHFGFVVPDLEAMIAKLPPEARTSKRPADRPFAEWRTFDPDGNGMDISQQLGYEVDPDVWIKA